MNRKIISIIILVAAIILSLVLFFSPVNVKEYASSRGEIFVVVSPNTYFNGSTITSAYTLFFSPTITINGEKVLFMPKEIGVLVNGETTTYMSLETTVTYSSTLPYFVFSTVPKTIIIGNTKFTYIEKKEPLISIVSQLGKTVTWRKFWLYYIIGIFLFIASIVFADEDAIAWSILLFLSIMAYVFWIGVIHDIVSWTLKVL